MNRAIVVGMLLAGGLVAGGAHPAGAASFGEGSLDAAFGTGGAVTTDIGVLHSAAGAAAALQADGKIVVAGGADMRKEDIWTWSDIAVARYKPDGSLDTGFGSGGTVTTRVGITASAGAVAIQPDGKIVVAGGAYPQSGLGTFVLARYTPAGVLDTSFGTGGIVTTQIRDNNLEEATAVVIQPDGKIIAAGDVQKEGANSGPFLALARYTPGGALDTSFGVGGTVVTTTIGDGAWGPAMALQPDGKIVLLGNTQGTFGGSFGSPFALARYTSAGNLDAGFGTGGIVITPVGPLNSSHAYAVALQPDGKIVAAGDAVTNGSTGTMGFALARYTTAGKLDTSFGSGGTLTTPMGGDFTAASAYAVAIEPTGKIVAAGSFYAGWGTPGKFALTRYTTAGKLDAGFGSGGRVTTVIGDANAYGSATAYGVALQTDGKIVAAGDATVNGDYRFAVARYVGDATAPTNARLIGLAGYTTTLTPTVKWAATDADTGVQYYDVRYRYAGYNATTFGSYQTWQTSTTATHAVFKGAAGRTYCFQVRAYDKGGNGGAWGAQACTAFPVDDRTLVASGTWTKLSSPAYYLGTARRSTHSGASLRLAAHYRHLALVASTGPGNGTVKVYLGSTLLKKVSLAASSVHHKVVISIATASAVKSGIVKIVQASNGKSVVIEGLAVSLA